MNYPKPSDMPKHPVKTPIVDPLKAELEAAFGIALRDVDEFFSAPDVPAKKPFVRKPHLTDRPLKNDPNLLALKAQLTTIQH